MANPKTQPAQTAKPKTFLSRLIPLLVVASFLAVATLQFKGVINVSGFLNKQSENYLNLHNVLNPTTGPANQNPIVFNMPPNPGPVPDKSESELGCEGYDIFDAEDGEVGELYENKLSIRVIEGEAKGSFKFLPPFDSIAELAFPPGIKLHPDGTLKGVPTKAGSYEFEACAEDEDYNGDCFCVRLFVRPKKEKLTPVPGCYPCPTTSCDTGNCCCEIKNNIRTSAVLTFDCCNSCPSDTHEVGKDRLTQGGPYRICECNKC